MADTRNGGGRQRDAWLEDDKSKSKDASADVTEKAKPKDIPSELDDQGKENASQSESVVEIGKAEQQFNDPMRATGDMKPEQVETASPNHLLVPDPLPALDRPIFEPPRNADSNMPMSLHPNRPSAAVEADIENLRTRLGELREFFKRFPHTLGGELGALVNHLRVALGVPITDPVRENDRRQEDLHIAQRRRAEDLASGGPSATRIARRQEEDDGLAAFRRMQDTPA